MPREFPDECMVYSSDMWDAMVDLAAFGAGVVSIGAMPRWTRVRTNLVQPEPMRETLRERNVRLWKRPMFTIKDDDRAITWDHEAMAKRPFLGRGA